MAVKSKQKETKQDNQSDLLEAIQHVSDEKGVPVEQLVASIEGALLSAYKKAYGGTGTVSVRTDFETNNFEVYAQKRVVQQALNPNTELSWREAREQDPGINLGDTIESRVTPAGFGRIAAQTAKQVLLQKLREVERRQVVSEYEDRIGEMFRGRVERMERGDVIVTIGKAETLMPRREQVPGEHYRFGDSIFVYVVDVRTRSRGPSIVVSRTHPGLVRQLFTLEVPEISDGIVEIKSAAREAGQRTKIAVAANNPDVDPVGACVGPRGMRVGRVVNELGNEKVDIVRWHPDPIQYISNALSPAQITKVILEETERKTALQSVELREEPRRGEGRDERDDESEARGPDILGTATVIVSEDQQSLAIGKQGQNVRLAAKLTRWRIDIRTEKQYAEEQAKKMFEVETVPSRAVITRESADMHADIFPTTLDATESDATESTVESTSDTATDAAVDEGSAAPANDVEIMGLAVPEVPEPSAIESDVAEVSVEPEGVGGDLRVES